jgi:hypothetical protein
MKNKRILEILEKLFAWEIAYALKETKEGYQLPKRIAKPLIEMGFVETYSVKLVLMNLTFHRLTDYGRFFYCRSCKDE